MGINTVLIGIINIGVWVLLAYVFWRVGRIIYLRVKEATKTKAERTESKNNQGPQPPKQDPKDKPYTEAQESRQHKKESPKMQVTTQWPTEILDL